MINLDYERTIRTLLAIQEGLNSKETLDANVLDINSTVIVVVDMINGFCKVGNLYSDRNEKLIFPIANMLEKLKNYKKIFFSDFHTEDSTELNCYPNHCTSEFESDIVKELKKFIGSSCVYTDKEMMIPSFGTMAHSWVQLFGDEYKAFKVWICNFFYIF